MQIDWSSLIPIIGGIAALFTAIATFVAEWTKRRQQTSKEGTELAKIELDGKLTAIEVAERLQTLYLGLSEKQSKRIEVLEKKVERINLCVEIYRKENRALRAFIRKIFIQVEEGVHKQKLRESPDTELIKTAEIVLAEWKDYYKKYLDNGDKDILISQEGEKNVIQ